MSRLVRPEIVVQPRSALESVPGGLESAPSVRKSDAARRVGDQYLDRVGKYIPGEVTAGYMALDNLMAPVAAQLQAKAVTAVSATTEGAAAAAAGKGAFAAFGGPGYMMALGVFGVCLLLTPFYMWRLSKTDGIAGDTAWQTHAVISTLAFIVWAIAVKGSVFYQPLSVLLGPEIYGTIAGAALIIFTIASGAVKPAPVTVVGD
jgi:hypothetical protein